MFYLNVHKTEKILAILGRKILDVAWHKRKRLNFVRCGFARTNIMYSITIGKIISSTIFIKFRKKQREV